MSTATDTVSVLPPTPQSSKKRKIVSETSETPRKKRKHDKIENGPLTSQETVAPKKDKKNKKDKSGNVEQGVSESQDTQDIELPNAQVESTAAAFETAHDDTPAANGIHLEQVVGEIEEVDSELLQSQDLSCFYEKRLSLQVPIPAISLASPTSSILALHLAPLLLCYFPPAEGIVLSFSDPVLSAKPKYGVNLPLNSPKSGDIPSNPPEETFARCADAFGVCWVWLTTTFLVFRPEMGDALKGWTNVSSEGFVGLVSYNYFQAAVGKNRIPRSWVWDGPTRENSKSKKRSRKGRLRDENGIDTSQEEAIYIQETLQRNDITETGSGSFQDAEGNNIPATQAYRVVDVELVPGHEKDKWTLQIDGSLLSEDEEAVVVAEERQRFQQVQSRSRGRSETPGSGMGGMPFMSGALPFSREGSSA